MAIEKKIEYLHIKLSSTLLNKLEDYCQNNDTTKSETVRKAIKKLLREDKNND